MQGRKEDAYICEIPYTVPYVLFEPIGKCTIDSTWGKWNIIDRDEEKGRITLAGTSANRRDSVQLVIRISTFQEHFRKANKAQAVG